ncbi:MAG: hypothetical protein JWR19_27, partial [Pedosphaera sp.]|nr:hypothetical protein [Pedosphaera sp.]
MLTCCTGLAQVNSWTGAGTGNWEDLTWSLAVRPASNQTVLVTNAGFKAVAVGAVTRDSFPSTMIVSNLTVSAPIGSFNTFLLNFVGTGSPVRIRNMLTVGTNGAIACQLSALRVEAVAVGSIRCVISGQVDLEQGVWAVPDSSTAMSNGVVTLNGDSTFREFDLFNGTVNQIGATTAMTNLNIFQGTYNLSNGVFQGAVAIGPLVSGGRFNQYGGTNSGTVLPQNGTYDLIAGSVFGTVAVGASGGNFGVFHQGNGLVSVNSLGIGGALGSGKYYMTNGTVYDGSINMLQGGFYQYGGTHLITNGFMLYGFFDDYPSDTRLCSYFLYDGILSEPFLQMGMLGNFFQYGGTNTVAGLLSTDKTTYTLQGGTLLTANTYVLPPGTVSGGNPAFATFLQSGGLHQVSNLLSNADDYELMGGDLIAGYILQNGTNSFNQGGGTATTPNLSILQGSYNLTNGILQGGVEDIVHGQFKQYGGTNIGTILPHNGSYSLINGSLFGAVTVGPSGGDFSNFYQATGVVSVTSLQLGGVSFGIGNYWMTNGVIASGSMSLRQGNFTQYGGVVTVTNGLGVNGFFDDYGSSSRFCTYSLNGGMLSSAAINMSYLGNFYQGAGTNTVAGGVDIYRATYSLSGGTLSNASVVVEAVTPLSDGTPFGGDFEQSGGIHRSVLGLTNRGIYTFTGGSLIASNINLSGTMTINNAGLTPVVSNSGLFTTSGRLTLQSTTQQLGQLLVAGNASIDFLSGATVLKFTGSSG